MRHEKKIKLKGRSVLISHSKAFRTTIMTDSRQTDLRRLGLTAQHVPRGRSGKRIGEAEMCGLCGQYQATVKCGKCSMFTCGMKTSASELGCLQDTTLTREYLRGVKTFECPRCLIGGNQAIPVCRMPNFSSFDF